MATCTCPLPDPPVPGRHECSCGQAWRIRSTWVKTKEGGTHVATPVGKPKGRK